MGYGLSGELLWTAVGLLLACCFVATRQLPTLPGILIAVIRVAIPLAYFVWYYDGYWTCLDDLVYIEQGQYLVAAGFDPLTSLTPQGIRQLQSLADSQHVLYTWWNLTTMWLLGAHYYAPVFGNVLVTFVAGHVLALLLRELGFERRYRTVVVCFYLLHWETVAWSSILNLKDCIVQLLTIALFYFSVRVVRRRSLLSATAVLAIVFLFQLIRFYVPALFAVSVCLWLLFEWRDAVKFVVLTVVALAGWQLAPWHYFSGAMSPPRLLYGLLRFTLTPQPWSVAPNYSFLYLPSLAHWIFFLPSIMGIGMLCRSSKFARLMVAYGLVILLFYAAADNIQGVRHRVQISFLFAWGQIHFLRHWTQSLMSRIDKTTSAAGQRTLNYGLSAPAQSWRSP